MKAWMGSNFGKIPLPIMELAAPGGLNNQCIML